MKGGLLLARVNHKKIKQLIAQKQKTITDRQFFSSRILAGHLADIALAQSKRYGYKCRVKVRTVWEPKNNMFAYSSYNSIWINAGHRIVTNLKTRPDRYNLVCGVFAHELGHILYTDFLTTQTYKNMFEVKKWYPEQPLLKTLEQKNNESDIWDWCSKDEKNIDLIKQMAHNLLNIIEDGYIENRIIAQYPGILGNCLKILRTVQYDEIKTVDQMIEEEDDDGHIFISIMQLLLSYVKWGTIKYGTTPLSDRRIQTIFSMLNELDIAVSNSSIQERLRAVNSVIIRCWPDIKEFLELCKQKSEEIPSATVSEIVSQIIGNLVGNSVESEGETSPIDKGDFSKITIETSNNREITKQLASEKQNDKEGQENDSDSSDSEENTDNAVSESCDFETSNNSADLTKVKAVSDKEKGRLPRAQTDEIYEPLGGTVQNDNDYKGSSYSNSAKDIERILENMAEKAVTEQLEKERTIDLNELATNISYGDIHKGVNMVIHRIPTVDDDMMEQYNEVSQNLLYISKQMQKSILQQLKDRQKGGKQTSLLFGRKLDSHNLFRTDGRVFCKNNLPNNIPELSVGLLLDESGSMCSCDRISYARATAIILYDFCKALNIPIMIYGHSTGSASVDLFSYAEFDSIDNDDCYRLMDISARNSNRDGAALRFVAEQLNKRHEDIKLLILVSDGQPASIGYYGEAAEEDLRGIRKEYMRKGILFIAAAIGDDKEDIERIYSDSFLDITDLNKLPIKLTNIIKKHIRV